MSTTLIIAIVVIVALVAVLLAARSGGPRVTHIEHRTKHDTSGEDE